MLLNQPNLSSSFLLSAFSVYPQESNSGAQEDMSPNTKVITTHRGINKTCPALSNPES